MITNITITKIDSRVYTSEISPKCNIAHNITLKNPNIISQPTPFGDKEILRTEFLFSVNYLSPSKGYIMIEGIIDYYGDNLIEVKNNWQSTTIPQLNNIKTEISNILLFELIPFIMLIAQRLKLPPALQIPMINFNQPPENNKQQNQQPYIG